ncbi:GntR family transcriptional regulator [Amycolatopsis sp. YIM 10]|uniref:GntR family transcriptional regulator n=1 Tax=Amycolatopsis sp. YIM 10 TaxID=2653857 RepID=UPI0012900902|nr:GntR family transcriptional regulator [Amycolatopsis sp. YIM 10]QFU92732.1 HTH-type transcriptional repressor YvoA [Amycolatopsis sp. YIM 10]
MLELGQVDRRADTPPYRQIAAMLIEAIDDGRLEPGQKLPSEAALIEHFGVARMTVRQATQELRRQGLVVAEHGRGVFVRSPSSTLPVRRVASDRFARKHRQAGKAAFLADAEKLGYQPSVDRIQVRRETAPPMVAERLRVDPDDEVVVRDRRYLANGRPIEMATSYVPTELAEGTQILEINPGPGGIYARLEERGHKLASFTEEVTARMPNSREVRELGLPEGAPVLTVIRTAFDTDGAVVEVCDIVKAASSYVLEYDFPAK